MRRGGNVSEFMTAKGMGLDKTHSCHGDIVGKERERATDGRGEERGKKSESWGMARDK